MSNPTETAPTLTELLAGMKPDPEKNAEPAPEKPRETIAEFDPRPRQTTAPKPSVGRVVHYFENCQGAIEPRAALVVRVHNATSVNLTVFDGEGYGRAEIHVSQGNGPGEWNWPERV